MKLVISDAHAGLKAAIHRVFQGAAWQRCPVQAMGNFLAAARKPARQIIAALIRTIFVPPDHDSAPTQLRSVVARLDATDPELGLARSS